MPARANPVVPWNKLRPVHGHKGYHWHFAAPGSDDRVVVRRDTLGHLVVGAVRPDPNPADPQAPLPSTAYDTHGESVVAGPYPGLVVRWLALRDRVRRLAAERATRVAGAMEMTTEDWLACVTLADLPSWYDEFGVTGDLPSGVDGAPTMGDVQLPVDGAPVGELLLRELGVDPEPNDPGDLPATVRDWFDEGFSAAWHAALVAAARDHLGTAGPWWTWPAPEPASEPEGGFTEEQWEQVKCRARELGVAQGRADGEDFPIPDAVTVSRILAHLVHDEPDDELAATFPTTPLSGQHGGEPIPASLYRALGVDASVDTDDGDLCREFEQSHWETFVDVVTARCRGLLGSGARR